MYFNRGHHFEHGNLCEIPKKNKFKKEKLKNEHHRCGPRTDPSTSRPVATSPSCGVARIVVVLRRCPVWPECPWDLWDVASVMRPGCTGPVSPTGRWSRFTRGRGQAGRVFQALH